MTLKADNTAPDFSLDNQDGKLISLSDYLGKKVLLYFYPRANTPGCNTQACSLNDSLEALNALQVSVIGISPDTVDKQKKFEEKFGLKFPLLSDQDHQVALAYGAWGPKKLYGKEYEGIIRSSFLIDEEGKLIQAWPKISPKDTVPKALQALEV